MLFKNMHMSALFCCHISLVLLVCIQLAYTVMNLSRVYIGRQRSSQSANSTIIRTVYKFTKLVLHYIVLENELNRL